MFTCALDCIHTMIQVYLCVLAIPAIVARCMMSQQNSNLIGYFCLPLFCVPISDSVAN